MNQIKYVYYLQFSFLTNKGIPPHNKWHIAYECVISSIDPDGIRSRILSTGKYRMNIALPSKILCPKSNS